MTRKPVLGVVTLVGIALLAVLAAVLLGRDRGAGGQSTSVGELQAVSTPSGTTSPTVSPRQQDALPRVSSKVDLLPRIVLFGDTVRARADVVVDRTRVDPNSVRIAAAFTPWEVIGRPQRTRRDVGAITLLRTTYVLRCLSSTCVPSGQVAPLNFDPARVTYARAAGGGREAAQQRLRWPVLTVYSRFASAAFEGRRGLATPWRAELVELPEPSHPLPPFLLTGLFGALGLVLLGVAVALAYFAWPRTTKPPPVPEAPPPPRLTPLEQALALLEDVAEADGIEDRRRSLELVAEALEEWGDGELASWARVLAWSESTPETEETTDLAARVRSTLEQERDAAAEVSGHVG